MYEQKQYEDGIYHTHQMDVLDAPRRDPDPREPAHFRADMDEFLDSATDYCPSAKKDDTSYLDWIDYWR